MFRFFCYIHKMVYILNYRHRFAKRVYSHQKNIGLMNATWSLILIFRQEKIQHLFRSSLQFINKHFMLTTPSQTNNSSRPQNTQKQAQILAITLDFGRKQKPRPKTERVSSNNIHSTMNSPNTNQKFSVLKNQQKQTTMTLLQKKKQYSMAIRQKNMGVNQISQSIHSSERQLHQNENINPAKNTKQNRFGTTKEHTTNQIKQKKSQYRNKSSGDILTISNLSNLNISHLNHTQKLRSDQSHKKTQKSNSKIEFYTDKKTMNSPITRPTTSAHRQTKEQKDSSIQKQLFKPRPRDKREQTKPKAEMNNQVSQYQFEQSSISFVSQAHYFLGQGEKMGEDLANFSKLDKINDFSRIESVQQNDQELIQFEPSKTQIDRSQLDTSAKHHSPSIPHNTLKLAPEVVSITLGPCPSDNQKELDLLRRHNSTYKKDLSMFRRQNSSLKREIDQLKKQLSLMKERNQFLEERERQQLEIMESMRMKMNQSIDLASSISRGQGQSSFILLEKQEQKAEKLPTQELQINSQNAVTQIVPPTSDDKLKEILSTYENNLFQAVNQNKKLEFRNYMLQKKLMDSTEIHRKQMAKQIAIWKERYIKARNENLRMKDQRGMMLLEMSISQDME